MRHRIASSDDTYVGMSSGMDGIDRNHDGVIDRDEWRAATGAGTR